MQALYQLDLGGWDPAADARTLLLAGRAGGPLSGDLESYALTLVHGVRENREQIDAQLAGVSREWDISRMAPVDRNILRLAAYEILHQGDVPVAVAIDEAVELAKRFGDRPSAAFINGLLDAIARKARPAAGPGESEKAS